ncbi:hypothetical protein DL95DRAFT_382223 [Leptodontidium sp. 2 PMI_412]|nr:hypothetical protein DL95DRAFT_382223 [Leptodontidium sp. 2 PMI_412]
MKYDTGSSEDEQPDSPLLLFCLTLGLGDWNRAFFFATSYFSFSLLLFASLPVFVFLPSNYSSGVTNTNAWNRGQRLFLPSLRAVDLSLCTTHIGREDLAYLACFCPVHPPGFRFCSV